MRCKKAIKKLNAYIDEELAESEAVGIESHLQKCAHCRSELRQRRELVGILDSLQWAQAPGDFVSNVRSAAEKGLIHDAQPAIIGLRRWNSMPALAKIAAAVTVFVGLTAGGLLSHTTYQHHESALNMSDEEWIEDAYFRTMPADMISDTYLALIDIGEFSDDF